MVLMTPDVNVVLIDFDGPERETVTHNEDDSYTIFINARLSHTGQLRAYEHAMKHILEQDFEREDVQTIEAVAHNIAPQSQTNSVPTQDYIDSILLHIRRQRKRTQRKIKADQERVNFLLEHCDMFERVEHEYLYSTDL